MNLFSLLDPDTIIAQADVSTKKELIEKLTDTLSSKVGSEEKLSEIRKAVMEREKVMSTGVGKGLAIPHGKTSVIESNLGAFALLKDPLNFDSIDGQPVRIVFLLVSPESNNSMHIKLLSRISRLMNSGTFRDKILSCTDADSILEAFREEEEKYFVNS